MSTLTAEEMQPLVLLSNEALTKQLRAYQDQSVALRGFAYRSTSDEWYLSAEPSLRSCCIGAGPKAQNQLLLRGLNGEELSSGTAIQVEGVLRYISSAEEQSLLLDQASWFPLAHRTKDQWWWVIACISLIISTFYLWRRCWPAIS